MDPVRGPPPVPESSSSVRRPSITVTPEWSFDKYITGSGTFRDDDLLVNKDGLRIVRHGEQGEPVLVKPLDNQLTLADLERIKVIGKGSSGVVQLVRLKYTNQFFALKSMELQILESRRKQIVRELKIGLSTQCSNIVSYYQCFYHDGFVSILMEYMDGGSLSDLLNNVKSIPEDHLSLICKQVLKGLVHLHHEKHIIHRDLKPSNILINHNGEVKISDFGISVIIENSTALRETFTGTYRYMAPERIEGQPHGQKSDIWSLGLVFLECATGKPAYPTDGRYFDLLEKIVRQPSPSASPNEFSTEFCSFISWCLQKNAANRHSAQQLLNHPFLSLYEDLQIDLASYFTTAGSALTTFETLDMDKIQSYVIHNS